MVCVGVVVSVRLRIYRALSQRMMSMRVLPRSSSIPGPGKTFRDLAGRDQNVLRGPGIELGGTVILVSAPTAGAGPISKICLGRSVQNFEIKRVKQRV